MPDKLYPEIKTKVEAERKRSLEDTDPPYFLKDRWWKPGPDIPSTRPKDRE